MRTVPAGRAEYGHVCIPNNVEPDWAPYSNVIGTTSAWGWTWVGYSLGLCSLSLRTMELFWRTVGLVPGAYYGPRFTGRIVGFFGADLVSRRLVPLGFGEPFYPGTLPCG